MLQGIGQTSVKLMIRCSYRIIRCLAGLFLNVLKPADSVQGDDHNGGGWFTIQVYQIKQTVEIWPKNCLSQKVSFIEEDIIILSMGDIFSKKQTSTPPPPPKNNNNVTHYSQPVPQAPQPVSKPTPPYTYHSVSQPISKPTAQSTYQMPQQPRAVIEPEIVREKVMYRRPSPPATRESQAPITTYQYLPKTQETNIQRYSGYQHGQPKNSLTNVRSSKYQGNNVLPPDFDPYEGCQGRWVSRNEFTAANKTFGYFKCSSCNKTWMSAHSKKQFKQACKSCNTYVRPAYLWVNDNRNYRKDKALVDTKKPHRSDLCQACQKGRCDQAGTYQSRTTYRSQDQDYGYSYGYDD